MKNKLNNNVLNREIGFFSATILVIANMIGTGIFTTSGFIMQELENPHAMLLCWFVGGIFALCGALCYGELGAMFPKAGGEYVFLRESFGKCMGFLSGWISLIVGFSAPIAAAAVAFATYSFSMFPVPSDLAVTLSVSGISLITISPVTLLASGVIIILSLVHYHSLLVGTKVQNGLTLFKIALLLVFIIAGLCLGNGSLNNFSQGSGIVSSVFQDKFAISLIFVSFAYSGWNAAAYLGGEIINPGRNIPLALFTGTFLVICLYLILNFVYIYALGTQEMSGVLGVGAKSAVSLFGKDISKYFSGAIAIGILSALSAMIMTGPRVYYAMSKDRVFFELFAKVNKIHKTPAYSIFLQAGIAILLVLTSSFDKLLLYIGFTLSLFTMMTVVGMVIIRRRESSVRPEKTYKTFGYPVTPLLFILGNLWIIFYSVKCRPLTSLYGLLTIAAGIVVYFYFDKQKPLVLTAGRGNKEGAETV
ncbi:APC family permease [Desulfonema magnum]|uniref:Amino acid permease n=1 Tax=Desulfonema magnum TaxID=45655 RepID=A0A975GSY6_9BACT|nr:amino acid permease [Desulfonema magnum]QTA92550.1 Amino acid permease [Desulfonema magnum]